MRNCIVIVILLSALFAVSSFLPRIALNAGNDLYQQSSRKRQTRRTVGTNRSSVRENSSRDYSKFSHRSDKHKSLACAACHKAPTSNWQTVSGAPGGVDYPFPDVADYPTHDACARCHRPQFFKSALPVICSICHTAVSPRARVRFAFGKPNQTSQFRIIFPHGKHQNVIASSGFKNGLESAHVLRRTSFISDDKKENYKNCTICHETQFGTLNPQGGFPDNFKPPSGTFKKEPVGHASCFDCHWKNQAPTHEKCEACHGYSETDIPVLSAPQRKSLKFNHSCPNDDHVKECTACHINITRDKSLFGARPDVPISACVECHGVSPKKPEVVTITSELQKKESPAHVVCSFCHTSEIGKRDPPKSHRAALE